MCVEGDAVKAFADENGMGVDLLRRKKSTSGRDLAGISPLARCFLT
jgi:hypothetical protein